MESAQFDPMGSHNCYYGIFESTQCSSDLHFISSLSHLLYNHGLWKSNDRQIGSNNNLDDRSQPLYLSLRFTLAHRFHGRKHASTKLGCESQIQSESESEGENKMKYTRAQRAWLFLIYINTYIEE